MILNHKYAIGTHITFYEVEMYKDFIEGLINLLEQIENKENVYLDLCFNISEFFEKIDTSKITVEQIKNKFEDGIKKLKDIGFTDKNLKSYYKTNDDDIYNIADYRRDFNYNYCKKVDLLMWGETDSLFPKESFQVLESVYEYGKSNNTYRYILSFSERKMWDDSWKVTEHVDYENIKFIDTPDQIDNENYAKSALSIEKMNLINSKTKEFDIRFINYPKIDGSCLVISTELVKAGVNLPHSLLCSGDDSSFGTIAKQIMGDKFIQFVVKNVLKVHARRHPKKRMYILNENNPRGFSNTEKGKWWRVLQDYSKANLNMLINSQNKFFTFKDVFDKLNEL